MKNEQIANLFEAIADLLEIKGEVVYKTLSYRRAAESIRALGRDLEDVRQDEGLRTIPGVGKALAAKIEELLDTGQLEFYNNLVEDVPEGLLQVLTLRGVGPKSAARYWKELGVTSLEELEKAAREGRVQTLSGMGARTESALLVSLEEYRRMQSGRLLLSAAEAAANEMLQVVRGIPGVEQAEIAGSLRRRRETIGDLDVVVAAIEPEGVLDAFVNSSLVLKVLAAGGSKASVILSNGVRAQLWAYPPESFGSVLQYATGSQAHNVRLRERAQRQALSLSERGFKTRDGALIPCSEEKQVYERLGLPWIPPELREDRGELDGDVPPLLEDGDLHADLHTHTSWSDGANSIEEMARAAKEAGLQVLAITDHSQSLVVAGGLMPDEWQRQHEEIERIQDKLGDSPRLLHGAEVEILADGRLDFPDDLLEEMDIVVASLHSGFRQEPAMVTSRLLNAIQNPYVDIIGHPTGRLLGRREGVALDMEKVLAAAEERRVALEINAHPERLDLNDAYARRAVEVGCLLAINSDSHHVSGFANLPFGISVARRGWVPRNAVVNAWSKKQLFAWLDRNR